MAFLSHTIQPGQKARKRMPFSEVCMHMRVAGEYMDFVFLPRRSVQLMKDGRPFSSAILASEAGIFSPHEVLPYYYPHEYRDDDPEANNDATASEPPADCTEAELAVAN